MYALMCLYLYCVALPAAAAIQHFWNEDEFCQNLNTKYIDNNRVIKIANITCNDTQPIRDDINMLDNVQFLCREFDSLTYIWMSKNKIDGTQIIVELISHDKLDMHFIEVNSSYIRLNNLKPNTEYAARFRKLVNGTTYHIIDMPICKTLDKKQTLGLVHTINISNFTVAANSALNTSLTWTPSNDMNCRYKIVYHAGRIEEGLKTHFVDVIREPNSVNLSGLIPDREYTIAVQSYYRNKSLIITGDPVEFKFTTPSCPEINQFNLNLLDLCPPGKPYDIKLSEALSAGSVYEGRYDVRVHWKSPNTDGRGVDYFVVKLDKEAKKVSGKDYVAALEQQSNEDEAKNGSSSGAEVYVTSFENVSLSDRYFASVQAFSQFGNSSETIVERKPRADNAATELHQSHYPPWMTVTLFASLALCAALAVGQVLHRRAAAGSDTGADKGGASAEGYDLAVLKVLDDVDVLLDDDVVTVSDVFLGHGHFGVVKKGALKMADGRVCSVAVKSLRDRPSGRDLDEFLREILLMQKVGKHPNIVSMIGCCLDANKRCMLVVEYCPLGDLQTYLRKVSIKSWYANDFYVGRTDPSELTAVSNSKGVESLQDVSGPPPMVFNNCYLYHGDENVFLTVDDLLRFASQAANGMMFLESNRVVHRDLAARNVLLSDHRTIKICDFGLSRDVYEQNLYQKSNRGDPLPVKWMALESLKYQLYTTQSDVWSFGVLLWEIMMLGGSPYPTISSSRIYEVLRRGYRMPRPTLCCYSLYEVMIACWHSNPANRPKFGAIKDKIDGIIENQCS
ncbi:tyrosine-protein kinase receptor torso-like [Rhopalosiphum maidis]|uniref:tyrosine-protein kinase receptor torso-like n=1 Tax=Rhopalosiphum maidis TaxID=43146 RepID=UPI000F001959|nr:tyrosine-protein kinase receptor torso-like [Rhopalosiphum maidis]